MSSESAIPAEVLEHRAAEERRRLHNSVSELKSSVRETVRDRLDAKRYAREYIGPAAVAVAVVGLLFGYSTAGMFTRR
jgi:hypothetical protein